jgi:tetratricopeptide (TPR) repeat protein
MLVLLALFWAVREPLVSRDAVYSLADPAQDAWQAEDTLRRAGSGALDALRQGLDSPAPMVRLRCARLLALQGFKEGDRCLLAVLRQHGRDPNDAVGAVAELFLLSVWSQREAPGEAVRLRLAALRDTVMPDIKRIAAWSEALEKNPAWADGYVQRALLNQKFGRIVEARDDALRALTFEPDQFEAVILLAQYYMLAGSADQACSCYERAVKINPRLKRQKMEEIKKALSARKKELEERRRERRRDVIERPVV